MSSPPATPPPPSKRRRTDLSGNVRDKTPPPVLPSIADTPARANKSEMNAGYSLKSDRQDNSDDIGRSVRQIPADKFIQECLPPLRIGHSVQRTIQELVVNGTLQNGRWALFSQTPTKQRKKEDTVFSVVETIANDVIATCCTLFTCQTTVKYLCNPTRAPKGSLRDSTCRPDGYFVLRAPVPEGDRVAWNTVISCGEFKNTGVTEAQVSPS